MRLKRLSASFGALQDKRLTLGPGLNIIHGPNEQGKSTWCAFIRAMLYGVNTSERSKDGVMAEKTKYRPWSGHPMEGVMEVETEDGRAVAIQRTALGPYPMKKLDARYSGTGEEVLALMNDNLGETLTGVPEAVFVRGAFIRQAGMKVSQTGELEQRIASLVSSGEEGISYSDTSSILNAWYRKRRHNKSGQIPALEMEIAALDQTMDRLQEASVTYNEISLDLDRAMTRTKELRADHDAHVELERRNARRNIADARDKLEELDGEIAALRKKLTLDGKEATKETIAEARSGYDKLGGLSIKFNEAKSAKELAQHELGLIHEAKRDTSFGGRSLDEAKELVTEVEAASAEAEKAATFNKQAYTIPLAILPVLALAAIAAEMATELPFPIWPLAAVALLGEAIVGLGLFRRWKAAKEAELKRGEAFVRLRVGSLTELDRELSDYEILCEKAAERKETLRQAEHAADEIKEEMQSLKNEFETRVKAFAPEATDFTKAFEALTEMSKVMDRLEVANSERTAAAHLNKTLTAQYDGDPTEPVPDDGLQTPLRSKSEATYELRRLEKELDTLKNNYAMAMGEVRAIGDPVVLGAKRGTMLDRLGELTRQYEALGLAIEVLAEADSEITARFSPLLGQRAGYYIDRLTGGEYKRVIFDKSLTPSAERAGETVSRDILYLSGGTVDQIYLALRLAICDLTFPPEKACPIILDDALISFDEARMGKALTLLKELSKFRQVLLFSCHNREANFFGTDKDVSVIAL